MAANDDFRDAPSITFADLPRFSERDFHPKDDINYDNPESVEDDWLVGLKDLKQESAYVRGELQAYVQKYADLGVDGIRWDAAKHVPESFFADYANQWPTTSISGQWVRCSTAISASAKGTPTRGCPSPTTRSITR